MNSKRATKATTARPNGPAIHRCAVYTRKSSEEGLEQDFNSLDAQREACATFILSQKHSGWITLPERAGFEPTVRLSNSRKEASYFIHVEADISISLYLFMTGLVPVFEH
jgi:hypothetical protein